MDNNKKYVLVQYVFKTSDELQNGLMNKPMPLFENTVALFIFPESGPQSMWMHNTYASLDIIFLNEAKKVLCIKKNATPLSIKTIPCNEIVKYVLEAQSGYIEKNDIKIGDNIILANYE
jgi:uncharacterized membrane protein (UPF0127 family)